MAKRTPLIIAELGSSPAPDWFFTVWCYEAQQAGADAVKVQLFKAEHFAHYVGVQYTGEPMQKILVDTEIKQKRPLEFPRYRFGGFVAAAHGCNLKAGASVFDEEAVEIVARDGDFIKLAARERCNSTLTINAIEAALEKGKPIYRSISTGDAWPFASFDNLTTLHAIQEYPAPLYRSIVRLFNFSRRMRTRRWGWSSHTRSIWDCVLAARLGASVIEKHFCLSEKDIEAGHSLLPGDFKRMVQLCK